MKTWPRKCVRCHVDLRTVLVCDFCGLSSCASGMMLCNEHKTAGLKHVCINCGSDGKNEIEEMIERDAEAVKKQKMMEEHEKKNEYEHKERIANSLERIAEALQRLANKE